MYEKILLKLKEQRGKNSSVSDRSLEDLARSYELFITTQEQLQSADFKKAIESIDGNIRHTASEALKTKEQEAEKEKARKLKEEEDKKKQEEDTKLKEELNKEEVPDWMKAYMKSNEEALKARDTQIDKLMQGITGMQEEKMKQTRKQKVQEAIKELPDLIKNPIMLGYSNASFTDDEKFTEYLEGVKKTAQDFVETSQKEGIQIPFPKGEQKKKKEDKGQTPELSSALEMVEKEKVRQEKESNN